MIPMELLSYGVKVVVESEVALALAFLLLAVMALFDTWKRVRDRDHEELNSEDDLWYAGSGGRMGTRTCPAESSAAARRHRQ